MGGSATTKTDKNPSFTVLEFDEEYMTPVNIKTYYLNLAETNKPGKEPQWVLLHDYLTEYGMEDLSPDSFAKLAD